MHLKEKLLVIAKSATKKVLPIYIPTNSNALLMEHWVLSFFKNYIYMVD